jgi:hypothetical protein
MWIIGLNQARRNQWCTSNRGAILYTVGIFGFSYKDRGSERLSVWSNTQSIRSELAEQNSETEGPDYSEQLALWEVSLWKMDGFKIRQLRQPGGRQTLQCKNEFVQKNIVPKALCDKIKDQIMGMEK